ncbi:hypothetical protein ACFO4N_17050 [Camelliibacillus cellulosilyticus]|uniref:Uncharacterized protein n=1 Tax=Camelliibacillus cellulosilyticus TaxID=2174486 RepID=A0ABV9GUP2_9BACL
MDGHIYNATVVHSNQEGVARTLSQGRKSSNLESKVNKRVTVEFSWMAGGAAVIGASLYLLSFLIS